jgi:hypothetical protein
MPVPSPSFVSVERGDPSRAFTRLGIQRAVTSSDATVVRRGICIAGGCSAEPNDEKAVRMARWLASA